jgi:hypothetical protein
MFMRFFRQKWLENLMNIESINLKYLKIYTSHLSFPRKRESRRCHVYYKGHKWFVRPPGFPLSRE